MAIINRNQQFFNIILAIVVTSLVFLGLRFYRDRFSSSFREINIENILKELAEVMNSKTPYVIEGQVVLKRVYFLEGERTIVHEYMLLNYGKDDFDLQELKDYVSVSLIAETETAAELAMLMDQNVIFEYIYFDNQKVEMFRIRLLLNTPITIIENAL